MADLAVLGELLIDFTEAGHSPEGKRLFEQNAGGAPANVAVAVSRLGISAAFVGKVGRDMHGDFLRETLEKNGIDTRGLVSDDKAFTTLAFVSIDSEGDRKFAFGRKPGADMFLKKEELNHDVLENCRILGIGSLSMTDEPARSATLEAIKIAHTHGARIAYDPNYRAQLWSGDIEARKYMRKLARYADYIKLSDDEIEMVTGFTEPEEAADLLLSKGAKVVVVTMGKNGALLAVPGKKKRISAINKYKIVDTTGAGDSFWGAFLYKLLLEDDMDVVTFDQLCENTEFASAAAIYCCMHRGALESMPTGEDVERILQAEKQ